MILYFCIYKISSAYTAFFLNAELILRYKFVQWEPLFLWLMIQTIYVNKQCSWFPGDDCAASEFSVLFNAEQTQWVSG